MEHDDMKTTLTKFDTARKTSRQIKEHLSKLLDERKPNDFVSILKEMKQRGTHVLTKFLEEYGSLLLLSSASKNCVSCVKFLVHYKDSINLDLQSSDNGKNVLLYATEIDSYEMTEILLISGGNCNLSDKDNATTMYNACKNSNFEIIKLLIDYGFNFRKLFNNSLLSNGRTALIEICEKGDLHILTYIVEWLKINVLKCKFDIDNINLYSETFGLFTANALHFACGNGHSLMVKYLFDELNYLGNNNDSNNNNNNDIFEDGYISKIDKSGEIINKQCKGSIEGQTCLYLACNVGNLEIIRLLKQYGKDKLDLNICEKSNGKSSLFIATSNNHYQVVDWFINENNCNVNLADKNGITPLMIACEKGNHRSLEILCQCERIEMKNDILDIAVKYGQTKSFQIVLNALLQRNNIETWNQLIESNILNEAMIGQWLNENEGNKNDEQDNNDEMLHFLNDLLRNVFGSQNFDLLLARLDYKNNNNDNTLEQQINLKYKEILKMQKLVNDIKQHCDKNVLNSFVNCINEMIINKCAINDTLMMISADYNYELFCNSLKTSIKDCISFEGSHIPNAKDIAWYQEFILSSNIFSIEKECKLQQETQQRQQQQNEQQLSYFTSKNERKNDENVNVTPTAGHGESAPLLLYDEIKLEIIDKELKKHEKYIENEINNMKKLEKDYWNNLINFKSFNLDFFNNIQQHNIMSRYDFNINLMNNDNFNGIKPRYKQGNLINDYHTGFNGNFLYDNTGYCVDLLILAHKINHEFENDCKSLFDSIGINCAFTVGNVKQLERSQMKASMEYYDKQFPRTSNILDFNRCCVSFNNCKDMINALNSVINMIGKGPNIQGFGCLKQIVRIKNTFDQMYNGGIDNDYKNGSYQYCDIKLNVIIQSKKEKRDKNGNIIKNNAIIGEIKFTLDFMLDINKTQHIFYNFIRNEQVYRNISLKLKFENNLYEKQVLIDKFENLKQIIATQNYQQLSNHILLGNFNKIVGLNFLSIKQLMLLCKENHWQKGENLLSCCHNNRYGTQVKKSLSVLP